MNNKCKLVMAILLSIFLMSCSSSSDESNPKKELNLGKEGFACLEDGSCNEGLECNEEKICVTVDDPDDDPVVASGASVSLKDAVEVPVGAGGSGGGEEIIMCKDDTYKTGFVEGVNIKTGSFVDNIQLLCADFLTENGVIFSGRVSKSCGGDEGSLHVQKFGDDVVVTGLHGKAGQYVDSVGIKGSKLNLLNEPLLVEVDPMEQNGGSGGTAFTASCSSNQVIVGMKLRCGSYVDKIVSIYCSEIDVKINK